MIYKVEQIDYMGYPEYEKYFALKVDAEKHFEKKFRELRKKENSIDMTDNDDDGHEDDITHHNKNTIKSISVWMWHKVSHEYNEYDRYPTELVIKEFELN